METRDIEIRMLRKNSGQLQGLPQNPRKISKKNLEKLKKSLQEAPEMLRLRELIVVPMDGEYIVIAGNQRLEAAKALGMETLPCKVLPADTEPAKLREYAIKDNLPFGEDDWEVIASDWDMAELEEWGMPIPAELKASPEDFGEDFTLPEGEKKQFGVMNFVVNDEQRECINFALSVAVYCDGYDDTDNTNTNGTALMLIAREWLDAQQMPPMEEIEKQVEGLRCYLSRAAENAGIKHSDIDKILGTNGMAGHYLGTSQWMFPTREAYEKLKTVMKLPLDWLECKKIEKQYNKAKTLKKI